MTLHRSPFRILLPLGLSALAAAVPAQSTTVGPFDSESFEGHRYALGTLPGLGFADGQDGWILFDSIQLNPNLAAATVQTAVVHSGAQAVKFDAAAMAPGCFGELRRNATFGLTTGAIEIEYWFRIASSTAPSAGWELYTQPFPHPASCQLRWSIAANGRVDYWTTPQHQVVQTSHFVTKDAWHHARTVVDIAALRTEIHVDGVLVGVGAPIASFAAPAHGFTQVNVLGAGNDAFYLDDFRVRERTAPHGLTTSLPRLPVNRRSVASFALAGGATLGNRAYGMLGTLSGTSPGTPLGSIVLPLNADGFTGLVISQLGTPALPGFLGVLNADGNAFAAFDTQIPVPAGLLGLTLDFAWLTTSPADSVSEPCRLRVTAQ